MRWRSRRRECPARWPPAVKARSISFPPPASLHFFFPSLLSLSSHGLFFLPALLCALKKAVSTKIRGLLSSSRWLQQSSLSVDQQLSFSRSPWISPFPKEKKTNIGPEQPWIPIPRIVSLSLAVFSLNSWSTS